MKDAENFLQACEHVTKLVDWLEDHGDCVIDHPIEIWFDKLPDEKWMWLDFESCHRIHESSRYKVYYAEEFKRHSPVILIRDTHTGFYSWILPDKFGELPPLPIPDGYKAELVDPIPDGDDWLDGEG